MTLGWQLTTHTVNAFAYYEGVFDEDMINGIIAAGEKAGLDEAYVGGNTGEQGRIDPTIRSTKIAWIPGNEENAWLYRKLTDVILVANEKWFGFELHNIEGLQYSVYNEGDFYDAHVDHHYQGPGQYPRKLSFSLQLTDPSEYEGGETRLHTSQTPFPIPQTKGTITLFPSYTLHDVKHITKGQRKALVGWVHGPRWK